MDKNTLKFAHIPVTVPAILNVIVIAIFNYIFTVLSTRFTNWENHKTET